MRRAEAVVLALRALGEAGQPATLTQRANLFTAAGEDFVRVGLMTDVPDQPVIRRIEDMMQSDSQFHHAKARAEVSAGDCDRVDGLGA